MSNHPKKDGPAEPREPNCRNCHRPLGSPDDRFCSFCGQKNTDGRVTMHDIWHEFLHNTLHLDGKFFKMLGHLVRPGALTVEFFKGHQKRYPHPTRFFVIVMGVFLLVLGKTVGDLKHQLEVQAESERETTVRNIVAEELDTLFVDLPTGLQTPVSRSAVDSLRHRMLENGLLVNAEKLLEGAEFDTSGTKKPKSGNEVNISTSQVNFNYSANGLKVSVFDSLGKPITDRAEAIRFLASREQNRGWQFDSVGLAGVDFSRADVAQLPIGELLKKYGVETWWQKLVVSRTIALQREPQNMLKAFLSMITWILLGSMVAMAGVLKLLYRRRNRFYVEHFVFLMHFTTMMAGLMSLALLFKNWAKWPIALVFTWGFIAFFIAMRRFYEQSRKKTFLKWTIYWTFFLVVGVLMFLLSMVFSFLLF